MLCVCILFYYYSILSDTYHLLHYLHVLLPGKSGPFEMGIGPSLIHESNTTLITEIGICWKYHLEIQKSMLMVYSSSDGRDIWDCGS